MEGSQEHCSKYVPPALRKKGSKAPIESIISNLSLSDKECSSHSTNQSDSKEIQCPFTWIQCTKRFDEIDWVNLLKTKLARKDSNPWRLYCFKMLLGCIYSQRKEENEAVEMFESCEKLIAEKCKERFFEDIVDGLQHIIAACRYHMNCCMGKKEIAADIFSSIMPFEHLNKKSKAAIWASKAYVLCEFGYDGLEEALECSRLAVKLDPDEDGIRRGAWYYLTGKIHYELRRVRSFNEMPPKEELYMLERSIAINPFPVHVVVLSDSYREAAKVLLKRSYISNKPMSDITCKKSKAIYEEAMTQKNLTVGILRRCGMGLMKLPSAFRNLKLAEEAFEMALKIAPENPTALLGMGYFKLWHKDDSKAALMYFKKSYSFGNYGAGIQVIKLQYKLKRAYDPEDDCNRCISDLKNSLKSRTNHEWMTAFLVIKGEYFLSVKRDLVAAAKEWEKAIDIFPGASNLQEYRYLFTESKIETSIYKILIKEINEALMLNQLTKESREFLLRVQRKCEENL